VSIRLLLQLFPSTGVFLLVSPSLTIPRHPFWGFTTLILITCPFRFCYPALLSFSFDIDVRPYPPFYNYVSYLTADPFLDGPSGRFFFLNVRVVKIIIHFSPGTSVPLNSLNDYMFITPFFLSPPLSLLPLFGFCSLSLPFFPPLRLP